MTSKQQDMADAATGAGAGGAGGGDAASTATNGHWIHDDVGPRRYVESETKAPQVVADGAAVVRGIEERLGGVAGLDAHRVHVALVEGRIVLSGRAADAEARRIIGRIAVSGAEGLPVENRISMP